MYPVALQSICYMAQVWKKRVIEKIPKFSNTLCFLTIIIICLQGNQLREVAEVATANSWAQLEGSGISN